MIAAPAVMFLVYFVIARPAWLIVVGGVIVGLSMPVACVIGIWLNRIMKRQAPELAQSPTLPSILLVCAAIIIAIQVTGFVMGLLEQHLSHKEDKGERDVSPDPRGASLVPKKGFEGSTTRQKKKKRHDISGYCPLGY